MSKDILYNPSLGYSKNYYTEGKIETAINNTDGLQGGNFSQEEHVNKLIAEIDDKIKYLPDEFISIYLPPYYAMKDEYDRLINSQDPSIEPGKSPDEDPDKDSDMFPIPPIIDGVNPPGDIPPLFEDNDNLIITPEEDEKDPVDLIKKDYYIDFIDIYEDYLKKTNIAIQNHFITTLQVLANNTIEGEIVDYTTKSIKNKNLKHLSDYLIKSDISLVQIMRLHRKLFNIDEIILHIRAIRIANEQRLRYVGIEEIKQKNYLDVDSNVILKESVRVSEKKYEENLYALYKYLNSSVILLDESLKAITKQNKAMAIINNYEERDKK